MERQGKKTLSTERRHWITFRQNHPVPDGEKGFIDTWVDFISCFAAVYPYRADQVFNFRSVNVEATHLVRTSGYLRLPVKTRWAGQVWDITWTGIPGARIQLHYQVDSGLWIVISASEINNGLYSWTIPAAVTGKRVRVRIKGI